MAGLAGLFAALIIGWAFWQTGSFSLVWPYLQGQRLLFDPPHVSVDNASPGMIVERTFRVANRTSADVTLLGARPSCGCITMEKFPITIPAGQDQTLTIKLNVPPTVTSGPFEHSVTLFVDHHGTQSIVVSVSGRVE